MEVEIFYTVTHPEDTRGGVDMIGISTFGTPLRVGFLSIDTINNYVRPKS